MKVTSNDGKLHWRPRPASPWTARLRLAATVGDLMGVVRSYLAACEKSEIRVLSRAGERPECAASDDIRKLAVCVATARAEAGPDAEGHEHIRRLFDFLTDAATRLGHLELEARRAAEMR